MKIGRNGKPKGTKRVARREKVRRMLEVEGLDIQKYFRALHRMGGSQEALESIKAYIS